MAEATSRPNVKTPLPQRDDLQRLIPDNVRLRRALEQLFTDVSQTIPDAIQAVGDASQAVTEDVSMGLFGATDRKSAHIITDLADALDRSNGSVIKRLTAEVADLESLIDLRDPVKPRIEGFIAPTLLNAWANNGAPFENAGFYKDPFGRVHLRGTITGGTIGLAAFTLPAGYRPANQQLFAIDSAGAFGRLIISAAGNVTPTIGSNVSVSMDGVTFRAN